MDKKLRYLYLQEEAPGVIRPFYETIRAPSELTNQNIYKLLIPQNKEGSVY